MSGMGSVPQASGAPNPASAAGLTGTPGSPSALNLTSLLNSTAISTLLNSTGTLVQQSNTLPEQVNVSYVNPRSMLALSVSLFNICTIIVILRLLGRRLKRISFGVDDVLISLAWLATMALCVNMITAVAYGLWGVPLPPEVRVEEHTTVSILNPNIFESNKFLFVQELIFPIQLTLTKTSILFSYIQILCPGRSGWLYRTTLTVITVAIGWGVTTFLLYLFQCGARPYLFWSDPLVNGDEKCLPPTIEIYMTVSDNILDFIVFLLPMHRIFTLQLPIEKRLFAAGVFAIGGASVIASLVRTSWYVPTLNGIQDGKLIMDPNFFPSTVAYWNMIEAGLALIAACLPSMRIFFDSLLRGFRTQIYGSYIMTGSEASIPAAFKGSPRIANPLHGRNMAEKHGATASVTV